MLVVVIAASTRNLPEWKHYLRFSGDHIGVHHDAGDARDRSNRRDVAGN
jgi:hypothetical protein